MSAAMKPKPPTTLFFRSLQLAVALVCALMALFAVYVVSEKKLDRAHEQRYRSHLLAEELRQSSDDLTRMVRSYVKTGSLVYKQQYLNILAIREGNMPRPPHYESIFWDLVAGGRQLLSPEEGPRVALLSLMQQAGFTEAEFTRLAQAKANSDELARIELAAMALVESSAPGLETRRNQASQMLFDAAYQQAKIGIMQPIHEVFVLSDQRTQQTVQDAERTALLLRVAFMALGLVLLLALWRVYKTLQSTLGGALDDVHAQITRLGHGQFTEIHAVAPGGQNNVLGWLAQTERQLRDVARAHLDSEARLLRLTRLYAALSACNQAIVRCTTEAEMFEQVCRAAVEHGGMKMAWIGQVDTEGSAVIPLVSHGSGVAYLNDVHISLSADNPFGQGPTGLMVRMDQPFWCQDFQHDPCTMPWHTLGAEYGWAGSAALPLHRNGAVIGTLTVYADQVDAFDEATRNLLVEMASDIDHALKNFDFETARAQDQAQRERAQQMDVLRSFMLERLTRNLPQAQVLEEFVLKIEAALPGALCSVLLLDPEGQRLHLGAAPHLPAFYNAAVEGLQIGLNTGSCGTAALTAQRVIVGDIATHPFWADYKDIAIQAGLGACWSEPILAGDGHVLGTFAIYHPVPALPTPHELSLIDMAARLTAIALERQHAESQLQLAAKVFEQGSESIMITDSQRRIVRVNQAFSRITGYSEAEALGRNPSMLSSPSTAPGFFLAMWEAVHAHGQWQGEVWSRHKDGTVYPELLYISLLRDASGAVTHYVGIASDLSKHKKDEEHIRLLADFDALTRLPNRRLLHGRVEAALTQAQQQGTPLALMFLDLDRFKNVNDSLGHHVGDELLIQVAQRLQGVLREQDTVCRLGGDEFVLLCTDTDAARASQVAAQLLEITVSRYQVAQHELAITFSIGIALSPADGDTFEALSMRAETAMYRAKQAGRNVYRFFTVEMQVQTSRTLQLENGLRRALELQQLHLVYQPQVSLKDGHIVGMEALLRWQHPTLGQVSPAEFIPVAEESGLILPIGEWVMRTAAQQMRVWLDAGLPLLQVAVNLSAVQFRHANLPALVTQVLADAGLPPQYLELELTEGVAMNDPLGAMAVMTKLHERGVRMSIDDFGTGYSSLSYLKRFQVYKLKIDQSFVRDITDDPDDKAIVVAVIALARSLGFQTIAEGVETQGQLDFLREQGCDEVQGYFYSKPLPAEAFEAFVRHHAAPGAA
jgi:diguanylate cyclase (GGDEF)-like protein/PAS domain S-box-containing protein